MRGSLLGRLAFLAKDTATYGAAASLNRLLTLVTFPLLTRQLSSADFGLLDTINTGVVLLVVLMVFGQDSAVARFLYDFPDDDRENRRQVVSQSFAVQVVVVALAVPLVWIIAAEPIAAQLPHPDARLLVGLALLQAPCFLLVNFSQNILKWTFARQSFFVISVGSTVMTAVALIMAIWWFDVGLVGVLTIYLITRATFGFLGLWFVRDWLVWPTGSALVRRMLLYAAPWGLIAALLNLQPVLERIFVLVSLEAAELGYFAVAAKVAGLLSLPITAFQIAWGPFSLAIHRDPGAARTYQAVLKALTILLLVAVLALTAVAVPLTVLLASEEYQDASRFVFLLAFGLAIAAVGSVTELGISIAKRSDLKLISYGVAAVASILVMQWLIPVLGLWGAVAGALVAQTARMLIDAWMAARVYPLDWGLPRLALAGGVACASGLVHQALGSAPSAYGVSVIPVVGGVLTLLTGWWVVLSASDRVLVAGQLKAWRQRRAEFNAP